MTADVAEVNAQNQDQYGVLGLSVVSRHEAEGIQGVVQNYRSGSRKIKVVQLITALALLFFLFTDMLPTPAVILSAAAVFVSVIVVGRRLLAKAVDDAEDVLKTVDPGNQADAFSVFLSSRTLITELVDAGVATAGTRVLNVENDSLVLCEKTAE